MNDQGISVNCYVIAPVKDQTTIIFP
jgi:hypothetical protein